MDALTSEVIAERVAELHTKRYPNGCGTTWKDSCDDCCERVGANPPGPIFTLAPMAQMFGRSQPGAEFGAFDPRGGCNFGLVATGQTPLQAYRAAVDCDMNWRGVASHGRRLV